MATVSQTITAVSQSGVLEVLRAGENVTISLSGTYDTTTQMERAMQPDESAWEVVLGPFTTANATVSLEYQTKMPNEKFRLNTTVFTSGSVTATISDSAQVLESFTDDAGVEWMEVTEDGVTVRQAMTVDGALTITGATTLTGALTQTGAVAIDDTTASTSGTTGSLQTDGGLGVTLDIFVDATVNAGGDTAAGDNAAMGYTATEGLILTGQGSSEDVTIKNDADAAVLTVATGTTNVDIVGDVTAGTVNADGDTAANDAAAMGYTASEGLILTGQGSTNDVTIKNDADADVISIPTGGTAVTLAGAATAAGIVTAAGGQTTLNIGTVPGTVTAVEWGDGYNHVTVLTVTAAVFVPDVPADAEEVGALIYTFPAGDHVVNATHLDITAVAIGSNTNAADVGCGSTLAAGDGTTLQAATDEDFVDGQTVADISSPALEISQAGDGTVFNASDSKLFHINMAGLWTNAPGAGASTVTATVTISWTFLGA